MDNFSSSKRNTISFVNLGFAVIVGQEYAAMLHRFEKFHTQLEPGFNFKIPFIDKVQYVHDLREQVIEFPLHSGVTKDNVLIEVDGVIYIQIVDPVKASYNVENYEEAIVNADWATLDLDTMKAHVKSDAKAIYTWLGVVKALMTD